MAAYQGERFIGEQLRSIFAQLKDADEAIVVDDCSTDGTFDTLNASSSPRLTVIRNATNEGVLRSFEKALQRCSGEIIFLSDQDDIWLPGKVDRVLEVFANRPEVTLLVSDAILIDDKGQKIGDSFYAQRGRFRSGVWSNLLIGKFHGCTMAFRSSLLEDVLPFPPGTRVHHDTWIGCVNSMLGGETAYVAEPLAAYRRHSSNVTGRIRLSNLVRLRVRWDLFRALIALRIKRTAKSISLFSPEGFH